MIEVIGAEEARWPPTFTPDRGAWTLSVWWMIDVASHSILFSTTSIVSIRLLSAGVQVLAEAINYFGRALMAI